MEQLEQVNKRVDDLLGSISQRVEDLVGIWKESQAKIDAFSKKVKSMHLEITQLQESGVALVAREVSSRVKVPEPAPFDGVQSAKTIENFLWDVNKYFKAAKVPELEQTPLVGMMLNFGGALGKKTISVQAEPLLALEKC